MSVPEKITLSGLSRGKLEALAKRLLAENAAVKLSDCRAAGGGLCPQRPEGPTKGEAERHGQGHRAQTGRQASGTQRQGQEQRTARCWRGAHHQGGGSSRLPLHWWFYADLKAYRRAPDRRQRTALRARFDRIFRRRTRFVALDRLLQRLHANKQVLLRALNRPEVPLHTNGWERDLRPQVIKRKISGGTRSDADRNCRDAFLGLLLTCQKLGVSFWKYLGYRLGVPDTQSPYLPDLVSLRSAPA